MQYFVKKILPSRFRRLITRWLPSGYYKEPSWSQGGEDRILLRLLRSLIKGRTVEYIDIGAYHPFHFSNTALLYKEGGKGVLVEPNPHLVSVLKVKRSRDIILQCGISVSNQVYADYYMFDSHTLNTFSQVEAERYAALGQQLVGVIPILMKDVNEILCLVKHLDFLNLDVEGMDLQVLQQIDWENHRPTTLCVETVSFEMGREPRKLDNILEFMIRQGYKIYADTHINTIFVNEETWKKRFKNKY